MHVTTRQLHMVKQMASCAESAQLYHKLQGPVLLLLLQIQVFTQSQQCDLHLQAAYLRQSHMDII